MTFTYTDEYRDLDSSFVTDIFYNGLTKEAVVVLENYGQYAYKYDNVPEGAVDALVDAFSIGGYYNTSFKSVYGPATVLGAFYPQDYLKKDPLQFNGTSPTTVRDESNVVQGNFSATAEYSLQPVFDPTVSGAPLVSDATPEYSLQVPALTATPDEDEDALAIDKVVIHYTLNGRKAKFESNETDYVEDALDELESLLTRLGVNVSDVKVRKVVFKFV